jgi:hypothetical protein
MSIWPQMMASNVQRNWLPHNVQRTRAHLKDVLRRVGLVRDKNNSSEDAVGEVLHRLVLAGVSASAQQLLRSSSLADSVEAIFIQSFDAFQAATLRVWKQNWSARR